MILVAVLKDVEARNQKIEANEDVVPVRSPVSELSVLETKFVPFLAIKAPDPVDQTRYPINSRICKKCLI